MNTLLAKSTLLLCLISVNAFSLCSTLHIRIANNTNTQCVLQDFTVLGGSYEQYPPATIESGAWAEFDMVPYFYGPGIELTYSCNARDVTLVTQLDLSVFWGKAPNSSVMDKDNGLTVEHEDISGYCLRGLPGVENWTIKENG